MFWKSICQFAEDVYLWVQGCFLWLTLLLTLQALLLVLWTGDCLKCFFTSDSKVR